MDKINSDLWEITCSTDQFNKLKSDDRFLGLLRLARSVNALRFCQIPAIEVQNKDTPSSSRQLINSFLFSSSIFCEAFRIIEELGRHFHDQDSFKNGLGKLIRDKNFQKLRNIIHQRMRNKFVFHFDKDAASEALENFELTNYRFASGKGLASGEIYFGLADEVVINFLLQPKPEESDEESKLRLQTIIHDTTELMVKFIESAEKLITDSLIQLGWTLKKR